MNESVPYVALAAVTWFMTGVIWFVQVVHYPLFGEVGPSSFGRYVNAHRSLTTFVVALPMVAQLGLALWVVTGGGGTQSQLGWANLGMVAVIWLSTATCSIPCHAALCQNGYEQRVHRRLVSTNWVRTVMWTASSVVVAMMLVGR
jgi:hypothetical protein